MALNKKILKIMLRPLLRHMTKNIKPNDIWKREEKPLPKEAFGSGSQHDWSWYFEGRSTVRVHSVSEIVEWLRGCTYVGDTLLFNELDFWQHPLTFEQLRKGDCEDHALWAWRKLKELHIPAEFVCGRSGPASAKGNQAHAWIHLQLGEEWYLMETVSDSQHRMTYSMDEIKYNYCPALSIDTNFKTYCYGGYLEFMRLQLASEI